MLFQAKRKSTDQRNALNYIIVSITGTKGVRPTAIIKFEPITEVKYKRKVSNSVKIIRKCLEEKSTNYVELEGLNGEPEFYPIIANGIYK